jgi:hypothetical protein
MEDCAKGTNSDGSEFNSAGWQTCKYQTGCEDAGNMCGGYNIAGTWVKAGKYVTAVVTTSTGEVEGKFEGNVR